VDLLLSTYAIGQHQTRVTVVQNQVLNFLSFFFFFHVCLFLQYETGPVFTIVIVNDASLAQFGLRTDKSFTNLIPL